MCEVLSNAGVPASFVRIEGTEHRFEGAHFTRAVHEMVKFERHLRDENKASR